MTFRSPERIVRWSERPEEIPRSIVNMAVARNRENINKPYEEREREITI